jgi:hypothetical protein
MAEFRFNFIDCFRAPRLALSPKKIWVQGRALALAVVLYDVFVYLAYAVSGADVYALWRSFYFFPPCPCGPAGAGLNAGGYVLWGVGCLALVVVLLLGMTGVAKVTVEQLRGNDFFSRREAGQFVRRHWRAVVGTPVALLFTLACFVGVGLLVGLVGKIPWVGDVVASLAVVPLFLGALLTVFLLLVFKLSFIQTPAIVATTGDDTFEASFELFSTLSAQPWRLVLYEILLLVLNVLATALFAAFALVAVALVFGVLYIPMGAKVAAAFAAAARVLPAGLCFAPSGGCCPFVAALPCVAGVMLPLPWPQAIAATFISLAYLIILGIVAAYALNVHTVGQTIIYVILRKKKDDENLLEMYDDELEQAMAEVSGPKAGEDTAPSPGGESAA